ncbi:hypothetical protein MES5069_1030004 [Mesorhizobium escarrei]|uniref:Uncharacterized protein n=1 Tax=Mesorhizobium escarrei TaxID=666018 RepID=A0ABM9DFC2_9HYPH|nr:hypothetical protein MES5069_1030004 [Mesorhizobium escarrei]
MWLPATPIRQSENRPAGSCSRPARLTEPLRQVRSNGFRAHLFSCHHLPAGYSQTMRTRFPGWLTFLQVSGFAGSDDGVGGTLAILAIFLLGAMGVSILRAAILSGVSGAAGKTSVCSNCGCSACACCGGLSQNRRTSSGLGMTTVPS